MNWNQKLADRLFSKAVEDANGCWVWTAYLTPAGYGKIGLGGRYAGNALAHRISYELMVADIPEGLELDHLCRNRACINPYHLDPVTHVVNMRRGNRAWRTGADERRERTHCRKGHPYDVDNTYWYSDGHRACRVCAAANARNRRAAQ